jgi:hypothetical protein
MTPTIHEIKAHLVAEGLQQDQLFKAFRAVSKAFEEAEERFDREIEADRQRIVALVRGVM